LCYLQTSIEFKIWFRAYNNCRIYKERPFSTFRFSRKIVQFASVFGGENQGFLRRKSVFQKGLYFFQNWRTFQAYVLRTCTNL